MKILHVNNQVRLGGAETVVRQLLRGFPGAQLAVADGKTFPPDVHPLYPRPLARLYHTRLHGLVERAAPRKVWTDRAFRNLANGPHDVIHLHNFHGQYASIESLAHLARRKPVVWTFHALWGVTGGCDHPRDCRRYLSACGQCPQLGRWPLGTLDDTEAQLAAKLALLADLPLHIAAPSRWLAQAVRESRVGRGWTVREIPNAVDREFADFLPAEAPSRGAAGASVLIVNRNFRDEQKGFPITRAALEAVARLANKRPRLILAGENSDWAASQLSDWECESLGYVPEPAALAALQIRADIFLFASPAENFPCVVLEAMAAGGCVVATPTGGVVEQVEDGVSGLLAGEISGPALAEALGLALSDPTLRARLGASARVRAQREFAENIFIERYRKLYEEVLRTWRPPE
jgi:glycosyltransferase involved in cell wall biosynthesis